MSDIIHSMELFESWLLRSGRESSTVEKHILRLGVIVRETPSLTPEEVNKFLLAKLKSGLKHTTLNAYVDTIRVYARYKGIPDLHNLKYFSSHKKNVAEKEIFTLDELVSFLNLRCPPRREPIMFAKFSLFWKLCALTGLRMGEAANLRGCDINFGSAQIKVRSVTGNKTGHRRIAIPPNLVEELKDMQIRAGNVEELLFRTRVGNKFSDHSWGHDFKKRLRQLGIERRGLTPYSLRHSFATELYLRKVPAKLLAGILGNSVEMIERTYAHYNLEEVRQAMLEHPLQVPYAKPRDRFDKAIEIIQKMFGDKYSILVSVTDNRLLIDVAVKADVRVPRTLCG